MAYALKMATPPKIKSPPARRDSIMERNSSNMS